MSYVCGILGALCGDALPQEPESSELLGEVEERGFGLFMPDGSLYKTRLIDQNKSSKYAQFKPIRSLAPTAMKSFAGNLRKLFKF
jgi:hypothetical protein